MNILPRPRSAHIQRTCHFTADTGKEMPVVLNKWQTPCFMGNTPKPLPPKKKERKWAMSCRILSSPSQKNILFSFLNTGQQNEGGGIHNSNIKHEFVSRKPLLKGCFASIPETKIKREQTTTTPSSCYEILLHICTSLDKAVCNAHIKSIILSALTHIHTQAWKLALNKTSMYAMKKHLKQSLNAIEETFFLYIYRVSVFSLISTAFAFNGACRLN